MNGGALRRVLEDGPRSPARAVLAAMEVPSTGNVTSLVRGTAAHSPSMAAPARKSGDGAGSVDFCSAGAGAGAEAGYSSGTAAVDRLVGETDGAGTRMPAPLPLPLPQPQAQAQAVPQAAAGTDGAPAAPGRRRARRRPARRHPARGPRAGRSHRGAGPGRHRS
ncbi:hypothetical protein GCM10010238_05270 [Streptomyces griseoviridis]|uniref:Uncharacterized protein n=1 Tax=Streptomyces griseoviridis TaxID=45398 RepID=A0A918G5K2_STRGD|nr:hypothetical protein GCM10010238_05270 [Streptomyces niveoruber]